MPATVCECKLRCACAAYRKTYVPQLLLRHRLLLPRCRSITPKPGMEVILPPWRRPAKELAPPRADKRVRG